jgi:hypothetical protein
MFNLTTVLLLAPSLYNLQTGIVARRGGWTPELPSEETFFLSGKESEKKSWFSFDMFVGL